MKKTLYFLLFTVTTVIWGQNLPFIEVTGTQVFNDFKANPNKKHPRLLTDTDGFEKIKIAIATDTEIKSWFGNVLKDADAIRTRKKVKIGRNSETDLLKLSFVYKITNDKKYKKSIEKILQALFELPEWDVHGLIKLDGSMRSYGIAIAYDWLYYDWTAVYREKIASQLFNKALLGYEKSETENIWWIHPNLRQVSYYNNHNAVCNTGPLLATLALIDHPKYEIKAANITSRIINSLYEGTVLGFEPDGAWDEGPGYYGYALYHLIDGLASVKNTLKTDYRLSQQNGFQKTAQFLFHLNGPAGAFNYGDGSTRKNYAPYLYWMDQNIPNNTGVGAKYYAFSKENKHYQNVKDILYFNPSFKKEKIIDLPLDATFRQLEMVSLRSAWSDDASYIAIKGSKGNMSHGNADAGQVMFQSEGEQWFVDLGGEPYGGNYFSYDTHRYYYYRAMAEGNNTMVINPSQTYQQEIDNFTRIYRQEGGKKNALAILDLNPAYSQHTYQAWRGIALTSNRKVGIIQDEVRFKKAAEYYSFFHTLADIKILADNSSAILSQNGKKLFVKIISDTPNLQLHKRAAEKLEITPKADGKEYNNALIKKLTIQASGVEKISYALLLIPITDNEIPTLALSYKNLNTWQTNALYNFTLQPKETVKNQTPVAKLSKIKLSKGMLRVSENSAAISMNSLLDNNPNTYWSTYTQDKKKNYQYTPQHLTIQLKKQTTVKAIGTEWLTGYQRMYAYAIEVSSDGKKYKRLGNYITHQKNGTEIVKIKPQKTRYVRIVCKGTMRGTAALTEVLLYK